MKGIRDRQIWLQQFNKSPDDLALATHMLKSLLHIDHSYLNILLANVIIGQLVTEGPCALFIERELPRNKHQIVTDFIGSGERVNRMLSSLWRVRSVRSWASLRQT